MAQRPISVNRNWLPNLWGFVAADEGKWLGVNLNNDQGFRAFVDEGLVPPFEALPFRQQHRLKETFRFALTQFDDDELVYAFESSQLPLARPHGDVRAFYVRLWHAMFGSDLHFHRPPAICRG
ncbi:hypothetical protein [Deinococcus sonorensis]|uniref:Uncharacterized protein n=1 Tax=Deinococcus sonorensis TaxID=309891 RepID=A0ABV8YBD6_9DEIO